MKSVKKQIQSFYHIAELIDYMILGLESGCSIGQAFFLAANNLPDCQTKSHCQEIFVLCQLGYSFRQAIEKVLARKTDPIFNELLENLAVAIQFGAPLKKTLHGLSLYFRSSAFSHFEKTAAEAPIKMIFPLVIFIFPVIFILLGAGALRNLIESLHF